MTYYEDKSCSDSRCKFNRKGIAHKISEHVKLETTCIIEYESGKQDRIKKDNIRGLFGLSILIAIFSYLSGLMFVNGEFGVGGVFLFFTLVFTCFFSYVFLKRK
jgi:hypothetical protein